MSEARRRNPRSANSHLKQDNGTTRFHSDSVNAKGGGDRERSRQKNSDSKRESAQATKYTDLKKSAEDEEDLDFVSIEESHKTVENFMWIILRMLGFLVMLIIGINYAYFVQLRHENDMWFSNINEVEREISFRTESGLYYSYYKQMVNAKSVSQGIYELTHDNLTEHPNSMNVLERMNIYQEVFLAVIYRNLPSGITKSLEPVFFYIYSVFFLHGLLICSLYSLTWSLSGSWLGGVLTAGLYVANRVDTTRVEFVIPLRESFALPFLWVQIAFISKYFSKDISSLKQKLYVIGIAASTFLFCITWQFAQFVMLLQAMALFGVRALNMLPTYKVQKVLIIQGLTLMEVCLLQFCNTMILGALVMGLIPASLIVFKIMGEKQARCNLLLMFVKLAAYIVLVLVGMVAINYLVKVVIGLEADEHIFKFIQAKFGIANTRDFDANLYLCNGAFEFLSADTFERLTRSLVFPVYVVAHCVLLFMLFVAVVENWSPLDNKKDDEKNVSDEIDHILSNRPELAFHTIQCVFFGLMALSTLRMKYLWTPYMCVLAGVALSDYKSFKFIFSKCNFSGFGVQITRHIATLAAIGALLAVAVPPAMKQLEELKEFYDPDTVDLMVWIKNKTPMKAAYTGSMQLMAGVKLCTDHPINNHPHYEDKELRYRTKELYQMYAKTEPQEMYKILKKYDASYMILEDSICLSPRPCSTPYLLDLANGHVPEQGKMEEGLVRSEVPRFCTEIKYKKPSFTKYFKLVFENKTFRVYKVL